MTDAEIKRLAREMGESVAASRIALTGMVEFGVGDLCSRCMSRDCIGTCELRSVAEPPVNRSHCEFCDHRPIARYRCGTYVRYACGEHETRVQRLVYIDLGRRCEVTLLSAAVMTSCKHCGVVPELSTEDCGCCDGTGIDPLDVLGRCARCSGRGQIDEWRCDCRGDESP